MSNMDFQRCNECNKVLDMTCSCSPDNYLVQLPVSDHVSKSELRAWCEAEENHHKYYDDYYQCDVEVVYLKDILEKFCNGEKVQEEL